MTGTVQGPAVRTPRPGSSATTGLTGVICRYAAATRHADLPDDVVDRAKRVILDETASAVLGASLPAGRTVQACLDPPGGAAAGATRAHVLGTGTFAAADQAALANGTAGHADEIDGAHVVGGHPGATLVHAVTAAAQQYHSTGAELLTALVLGYDIGTRLIEACGGTFGLKQRRHLHADFLHALGAAAACGRLAGLDAEGLGHALALATFQANGLGALFGEHHHLSKAFCNGQYAASGVRAALMAARGLQGPDDVLGARHGLLEAWGVEGGAEKLTDGLGTRFTILDGNVKFLRAGYPIHAVVEAALAALGDTRPEELGSIVVGLPAHALEVVDDRTMHNICVQDVLAATLLRRRAPRLDSDPFPTVLDEPGFTAIRSRIAVEVDPDLERVDPEGRGARVTLATPHGRVTTRIDHPRGHSRRGGASWEELEAKWEEALPGSDVARWVSLSRALDTAEDCHELVAAFAAAPGTTTERTTTGAR